MLSASEVALYRAGFSAQGSHRIDGRSAVQKREALLSTGTLKHTLGSASITLDNTSVLVAIQARVSKDPTPIQFLVDYAPSAKASFPDVIAAKSTLLQGLLEAAYSNYTHFLISQEDGYWQLNADVMILNDAGNIYGAAFQATAAALATCRLPRSISTGALYPEDMVGDVMALDPTLEEESISDAQLFVVANCTVRKTGRGLFALEQLSLLACQTPSSSERVNK